MKTFAINTLGCKVNQYESQQIREMLERLGLCQVEMPKKKPDLVVINTCCVTHTASAKSRQYLRKAQRQNPDAVIFVCGCLPTVQIGELSDPGENVHLIRHHDAVAVTLSQIVAGRSTIPKPQGFQLCPQKLIITEKASQIKHKTKLGNQPRLTQLTSFKDQTRAFLKIQDGCDGHCTYCIIPKTRPHVHSKPAEAALQEAQTLVDAGHREIVVTGICLGAYGQSSVRRRKWDEPRSDNLADLLEKMVKIPNLARIRVSSLEPTDVTPQLLDTFSKYRNIMPHLHLSLQSGSNRVLKRMCRQYTTDEFMRTVEAVKSQLDRPAMTADIIVGFPGETDADFQQTLGLAKEAGFAKMHVFGFSPRKGTAAAGFQGTVDNRVMKERSRILHALDIELSRKFRGQFIGEAAMVLLENSNGQLCGRSERYFVVYLEKTALKPKRNDLVRVKLTRNGENGAVGQVIASRS